MSKPLNAVLIDTATGDIKRRGKYPRWDMQPVSDPQPGEEWLLVVEGYKPLFDQDETLEAFEAIGDPHPDYPHLRTWVRSYIARPMNADELAAREAQRIAEIKLKADSLVDAITGDPERATRQQLSMLVKAIRMLVNDLKAANRLSQQTKDALAPLEFVAGKVDAIRTREAALIQDPNATSEDGGWPA